MFKKLAIPIILCLVFLITFCDKNPTKPTPGRRDYVWTLDTLNMPVNWIDAVWGASANDIWAVGAGGTQDDRMLQFNGNEWTTYTKEIIWCGGETLFGFSSDDIWMGGQAGWLAHGAGIWHYDGATWKEHYVYDVDSSYAVAVQDIWGISNKDLYASGIVVFDDGNHGDMRGFLLHYDGSEWSPIIAVGPYNSQFIRVRREKKKLFILSALNGLLSNTPDGWVVYTIESDTLREIYSSQKYIDLCTIEDKVYMITENSAYRFENNVLKNAYSFASSSSSFRVFGIHGRNELDFFISTNEGIAHYNGDDLQYLYLYPGFELGYVLTPIIFDEDIFWPIVNPRGTWETRNLILHGQLE